MQADEITDVYPGYDVFLEFLRFDRDSCTIEGYVASGLDCSGVSVDLVNNEAVYHCSGKINTHRSNKYNPERYVFFCKIPLSERNTIRINVIRAGQHLIVSNIYSAKFFPVCSTYKNAYYADGHWKSTFYDDGIRIVKTNSFDKLKSEAAFLRELWHTGGLRERKAVFARIAYRFLKAFKRKPIWIISDRADRAGDNGEAFFEYVRREHSKTIKAVFAIRKDSPDYDRIKSIGPVVEAISLRHKFLYLLSDCSISSQANPIINPFLRCSNCYRDILCHINRIFLQHGVTKDDQSGWLNRYSRELRGFVTAGVPEYESIVSGAYGYPASAIWLTGFPRFDSLYLKNRKIITFMPTWRKYLMSDLDVKTGIRELYSDFQSSPFYRFYDNLMNHDTLLQEANRLGYRLQFLPHPLLQPYLDLFHTNSQVKLLGVSTKYRDVYAESALVITDYSSAVFDFAYLRKPVIYCQFDADTFFSGAHTYTKGYFDYERDGFGEVEYDVESTVDRIVEYMKNGCRLKDKYRERIDNFFAFNDKDNCRRVYEKIIDLSQAE